MLVCLESFMKMSKSKSRITRLCCPIYTITLYISLTFSLSLTFLLFLSLSHPVATLFHSSHNPFPPYTSGFNCNLLTHFRTFSFFYFRYSCFYLGLFFIHPLLPNSFPLLVLLSFLHSLLSSSAISFFHTHAVTLSESLRIMINK